MAKTKLGIEGLEKFNRLRAQRLETLPLDLLKMTSMARTQGYIEEKITMNAPKIEKVPEKKRSRSR